MSATPGRLRTAARRACAAVVLAAALALALATTAPGARVVLQVVTAMTSGQLGFERVSGTLGRRIAIEGLAFKGAGFSARAAHASLRWRPGALPRGVVHIEDLRVIGLVVTLDEATSTKRTTPIVLPQFPMRLAIDRARVDGLEVRAGDAVQSIGSIAAAVSWEAATLELHELVVEGARQTLTGDVGLRAGTPVGLDGRIAWRAAAQQASIAATGTLEAIAYRGRYAGALGLQFDGTIAPLAAEPTLTIVARADPLALGSGGATRIEGLRLDARGTAARFDGHLSGTARPRDGAARHFDMRIDGSPPARGGAPATARCDWHVDAGDEAPWPHVSGRASVHGDARAIGFEVTVDAPFATTVQGDVADFGDNPDIKLAARWQGVDVPLGTGRTVHVAAGSLHAEGTPASLGVAGSARVELATAAVADATWQGRLHGGAFDLQSLAIDALRGRLEASGALRTAPAPSGELKFSARDLDLKVLRADLASRLAVDGTVRLDPAGGVPRVTVDLARIGGSWRGASLAGHAMLEHTARALALRDGRLVIGRNRIDVAADLGAQLSGRFAVDLPDLSALAADLTGRIATQGTLAGTREAPVVRATIDAAGLAAAGWHVASARGRLDVDLGRETASRADVNVHGITHGTTALGDATLRGGGTRAHHELALEFTGDRVSAGLRAAGAWRRDRWLGRLTAARVELPRIGHWTLAGSGAISVTAAAVDVERTCLVQGEASVCAGLSQWSARAGAGEVTASRLPLAALRGFLPADVGVEGSATADARFTRTADGLVGLAHAEIPHGSAELRLADGTRARGDLAGSVATLELGTRDIALRARGALGSWLELDVDAHGGTRDTDPLGGHIALRARDIAWIQDFAPVLAGTDGALRLKATLGGTLARPVLEADAALEHGHLRLAATGTEISALALSATSPEPGRVTVHGSARQDQGSLALDGSVSLERDAGWPAHFTLSGKDFPAVRLPSTELDLSPDLSIDWRNGGVDIGGHLRVPRVRVERQTVPATASSVSPDAIVVGGATDKSSRARQPPAFFDQSVAADVEIELGKDVRVDAEGLEATLAGGVHWAKKRGDSPGSGEGLVTITSGAYKAYGQHLDIQHGRLIFAGAIDNPGLDVQAVRPGIDVTAGVRVSGTALTPKIDLFSAPGMTDSEILSWIVTGHALASASSGEASLITRAALSLGAERSTMITNQIKEFFGLEELSVDTGATPASTSVTAGGKLSSKLSIRSQFNPFERVWSFFLTYKLTPAWSVQGESGAKQGADLLYSIESNRLLPRGRGK